MSDKIMTLFGEELFPDAPKPPVKSKSKKKQEEPQETKQEADGVETTSSTETEVLNVGLADTLSDSVDQEKHDTLIVNTTITAEPSEEVVNASDITINEELNADTEPEQPYKDDWSGDKQYYSIGEVADLMKVKTSKVRFWCNEFKMKIRTTKKGDRLFTPEQVKELRAIYHLVHERKFTLAGAREKLSKKKKIEVESLDLKSSLLQLRAKLVNIKNKLG